QVLLAPLIGEIPTAAGTLVEVFQPQLATPYRRSNEPVDDRGTELLQHVERQGWTSASDPVEKPDLWVQPDRVRCTDALRPQHPVSEAERRVDRVRWWPS